MSWRKLLSTEATDRHRRHRPAVSTLVRDVRVRSAYPSIATGQRTWRHFASGPTTDSRTAKKVGAIHGSILVVRNPCQRRRPLFGLWIATEPSAPCLCPMAHTGFYRIKGKRACRSKLEALL